MFISPPFEKACELLDEIEEFLKECGGIYSNITNQMDKNILMCIATGQFNYKRGSYFVGWWRVNKEDLPRIFEGEIPENICNGKSMYIVECGSRDKSSMREIRRKLRKAGAGLKGLYWRREGIEFKQFHRQEGRHGIERDRI